MTEGSCLLTGHSGFTRSLGLKPTGRKGGEQRYKVSASGKAVAMVPGKWIRGCGHGGGEERPSKRPVADGSISHPPALPQYDLDTPLPRGEA